MAEAAEVQEEAPEEAPAEEPEEAPAEEVAEETQEAAEWRTQIKNEEYRKFAESSTDLDHLVGRAFEMRQKLSNAIVKPGDGATEEQIAAYNKALGIPVTTKGYKIQPPSHLSEEEFQSEEVQARVNNFAETMLAASAPKSVVDAALDWYWKMESSAQEARIEADKQYADEGVASLKAEWGKDYDANLEYSNRGMEYLFENVEEAKGIEMKDGKFLLDNPVMIKALAKIGRETSEASLGPAAMTEETRASTQKDFDDLKKQEHEAFFRGDSKEVKRLRGQIESLAIKLGGNAPIVGSEGRQI